MSKLEEKIAEIIYESSLYNLGKNSHNAISELAITLKDLFKQWALSCLPERKNTKTIIEKVRWWNLGCNETIDEIRKRIEEV